MANNYKLKGHGSFGIREGWLNKGLRCINKDPLAFRNKKAADMLGVGSNMAQSIRYWLKSCNLMSESSSKGASLTNLGQIIFQEDPYFEDVFTLWILHYNLVSNYSMATTWNIFFNKCEADEYTREEIFIQLKNELIKEYGSNSFPEGSLKDDLLVLTNMYAKNKIDKSDPEENLISPFVQLGLLNEKNHKYKKVQPSLELVNDELVLYIIIKKMKESNYPNSISIDSLCDGENSLGKVLNMNRITINQYLDRLDNRGDIRVNRTAGLDMVYLEKDISAIEVIRTYYMNIRG